MSAATNRRPPLWEMVLASAGSGKTFRLSSRVIGLLAHGEKVESILATTFTRKAAGEILERVLVRLALGAQDEAQALALAEHARLPGDEREVAEILDQEGCRSLLGRLLRSLHRFNVGTLDSFFLRVAGCFTTELSLAPGWRIADAAGEARVQADALDALLITSAPGEIVEMLRLMAGGDVGKGVHSSLQGKVETLLAFWRDADPSEPDLWTPAFAGLGSAVPASPGEVASRCRALAREIGEMQPPVTKAGAPDKRWQTALVRLENVVQRRRWHEFLDKGLGAKLVADGRIAAAAEIRFCGRKPDAPLARILDEVCTLARQELAAELVAQGEALGDLTARYREAFAARQRREGAYGYQDVTEALRTAGILARTEDLAYRLGARLRHLLLDEFQDTSLPQWEVLAPLFAPATDGPEEGRSAVLVADPKQSIYGWRGARPELAAQVQRDLALQPEALPNSYRSSPVILDVVSRVFERLSGNSMIQDMPDKGATARRWVQDFSPQEAAHKDQPGYVRMVVGPELLGRGGLQPGGLDFAVEIVKQLRAETPLADMGILVRENKAVAYLMASLRKAGIAASGEGGTPLTDTAPVNALLSLLRLADHPGDTIARYHVARTPLGRLVGYEEYADGAGAHGLARSLRSRLLADGYGAFLDGWVKELAPACNQRERARLQQLVEMGFLWDSQATLRPTDFIRFVEGERVEDPSGSRVRVMTIHQCKGLEFDVVVLPQLHRPMDTCKPKAALALRHADTGRVRKIYPLAPEPVRVLFPEMGEAHGQLMAAGIRDELSGLYVAMTRARYALHMIIPADGEKKKSTTRSPARLLRAALAPEKDAHQEVGDLFSAGDPLWFEKTAGAAKEPEKEDEEERATGGPVLLRPGGGERTSNLPTVTPSQLEGGQKVNLAAFLRMDPGGGARLQGTLIHAWCEAIEWLDPGESGLPPDEHLRDLAARHAPGMQAGDRERLLTSFRCWLQAPAIGRALSRTGYPSGARVEREVPFARRIKDGIMRGVIDRLVLVVEENRVTQVEVLDFKTDRLPSADAAALREKASFYRPQMEAYKAAMVSRYALEPDAVTGALLFLRQGAKLEI